MKQLNWKSFAIGVLLTTTVMFGTGAVSSHTRDWANRMTWSTDVTDVGMGFDGDHIIDPGSGFEPFQAVVVGGKPKIIWRKRGTN